MKTGQLGMQLGQTGQAKPKHSFDSKRQKIMLWADESFEMAKVPMVSLSTFSLPERLHMNECLDE